MSKHDSTITSTKYIISLIIAIILSFIIGAGTGYFAAGYLKNIKTTQSNIKDNLPVKPLDKAKVSQNQNTNTPNQSNVKTDDNNSKDKITSLTLTEQKDTSKKVLEAFYNINSTFYSKLYDDSLAQSKSKGSSQDSIFKDKLLKAYEAVLTGQSLDDIKKFINNGNISGYYFSDFYNNKRNTTIKSLDIKDYKNDVLSVEDQITNTFNYYNLPNSDTFITTLKGKGITKSQYIKLVNLKPQKILVVETKNDKYDIQKVNDKWLISSDDAQIASTEITEIVYQNKTWSFSDFANKYLK